MSVLRRRYGGCSLVSLFGRLQGPASEAAFAQLLRHLKADGYVGFHHLYEAGRIFEAACWAHVRRKFYDIQVANGKAIAAVRI
jgi:hypothetical protein